MRERVPAYSESDEPTVQLLALTLTRVRKAAAALDMLDAALTGKELGGYTLDDASRYQRLREDLRGWVGTASRLLDSLGMSTRSRAALGLDIASARRQLSVIEYYETRAS